MNVQKPSTYDQVVVVVEVVVAKMLIDFDIIISPPCFLILRIPLTFPKEKLILKFL